MNSAAYAFYKGGCLSLIGFLLVRGLGRMCLGRSFLVGFGVRYIGIEGPVDGSVWPELPE